MMAVLGRVWGRGLVVEAEEGKDWCEYEVSDAQGSVEQDLDIRQ